jgi:class 3 adenylate cyclase
MYRDWSAGDTSAAVDFFSNADEVVSIGTDPDEFWVGGVRAKQIMHMQFTEIGRVTVEPGALRAYSSGELGWAVDAPTMTLADGTVMHLRVSYVFVRERDGWRIVHCHTSVGAQNAEAWGREFTTSLDAVASAVQDERPDMKPAAAPDGTVTIMFTDIESSTATNEALGDDRFLPLLLRHNDIVRAQTRAAGGSVVKSQGDGFMLAFSSARRGVECGIGIQREVSALEGPIWVRMGLHTGEPIRHSDDFFGRDVAYAARIGSAASGGEILVSSLVKSLVAPSGSFRFEGPRELELKGFEGPQPVYAVSWES